MEKKTYSERLNDWLQENEGETFERGKWRFWFPLLLVASFVNSCLTAMIFDGGAGTWETVNLIIVAMGTLLCWIGVGALHYSGSNDSRLARGVALLDSIALCFVIAHFCGLLYVQGHLITLRRAEAKYEAQATDYNQRAENIQEGNVRIAEAGVEAEKERLKVAKLENDTAYQNRKAAEAGGLRAEGTRKQGGGQSPALSTAPIDLAKPEKPQESSVGFLGKWDAWIRLANFGELILAAVTLIYIRNRSAKFNAQGALASVATVSQRQGAPQAALRQGDAKIATPVATDWRIEASEALRAVLKEIAYRHPGKWFKVDLRDAGGVWVRLCERRRGREVEIAKTKQSDKLLMAVDRPDFRDRLVAELKHQGFPIGGQE